LTEKSVLDQCIRSGAPIPERIAGAPELLRGLSRYWEAFLELGTCRTWGSGPGPIPWEAIQKYAQANGFEPGDEFDELLQHMRAMDEAYLDFHRKKQDRKSGGSNSRPAPRRRFARQM
jgi:hypothetical protein